MNTQANQHRGGAFPVEQPMEALKADHHFVSQLFDRYLNTQDMQVKKEAASRSLMLVEMHSTLEEQVFYPAVRQVDAGLVQHSEEEHKEAKQLMSQLKGMQCDDPSYDQLFRQFADSIRHHVQQEEQELFPKVQAAGLDLKTLGTQMASFEANMVHDQARQTEAAPR